MTGNEQPQRRRGALRSRLLMAWAGLAVAGIGAVLAVSLLADQAVGAWFLNHPSRWHNNVWVNGFRQLGKAEVPIWLLVVWGCITDKWRTTVVTIAALILVSLCVCPLKVAVRRARPHRSAAASQPSSPEQSIPWRKRVSFPSGDTAVAFAAATTLSLSLSRVWTPPLFAAAAAVGVLRITASQHYPSDVLAGAMIGVLCGMYAMRWLPRRWPLDQFRVPGRWRLAAGLLLVLVVPFVSPFIGMRSLGIFLGIYVIPLAILTLIGLAAARLRVGGSGPP